MRLRAIVVLLLLTSFAVGQQPSTTAQQPPPSAAAAAPAQSMPAAKAGDVDSVDHIVAALYDVISGPAGQARDWDRFRSLFIPEARLIPNTVRQDGTVVHRVLSVDEFASRSGSATAQQGFFENETSRKQEVFDKIVHVFSTYESRREKGGQPFARGINSIQLLHDGHRWFIVTVLWEAESPQVQIPAEYRK